MNEILEKIKQLYNLDIKAHKRVEKGCLSENYILESDSEKFFLKKYRFEDSNKIKEIHSVKFFFYEKGIPVILPIKNLGGETFFFYENGFFALFPFVVGKEIERRDFDNPSIKSLAEMQAKIHLAGMNSDLPVVEKFAGWNKDKTLLKIEKIFQQINSLKDLSEFDKIAQENILIKKDFITKNTKSYYDLNFKEDHLIHGDYLEHNVFFDEKNSVKYVFDWEKAEYAPRVYEFFRCIFYNFITGIDGDNDFDKVKLYIDSYSNICPISKEELERGLELFYLKTLHGTWVEGEHYLNNNTRVDHYLVNDFNRVKYLLNNYEKLKSEILWRQ